MKPRLPDVCLLLSLLGCAPLFILQAFNLWERPHFQFFPIAWLAFGYFVVKSTPFASTAWPWRRRAGVLSWGLGLLACPLAMMLFSPWVAQLAAILCIFGWGLIGLGNVTWSRWTAWQSLLLITLPLPGNWDSKLIAGLQSLSSASASSILDLLGVLHLRQGNILEIRSGQLFVDEACSGVDSLYALGAISVLILLWQQRPLIIGLLSLLTVPVWAWFGNVIRLTLIAYVLDSFAIDLATGWKHSLLGMVIFAAMAGCYFKTLEGFSLIFMRFSTVSLPQGERGWHIAYDRIVCFPNIMPVRPTEEDAYFAEPIASKAKGASVSKPIASVATPSKGMSYVSLGVCLLIGLGVASASGILVLREKDLEAALALPKFTDEQIDRVIADKSLPAKLREMSLVRFHPTHRANDLLYGEHSRTWTYAAADRSLMLSLDFPFRGFHPLWVCYENTGNKLMETSSTEFSMPLANSTPLADTGAAGPFAKMAVHRLLLKDEIGSTTYVLFAIFDRHGESVASQSDEVLSQQFFQRILRPTPANFRLPPVAFQFQLVVSQGTAISNEEKQRYEETFLNALPYAVQSIQELAKK